MADNGPLYLADSALRDLAISPDDVADAISRALAEKAAGRLHVTPKSAILPGGGRYMMSTLAVGDDSGLTVVKSVTLAPDNPAKGLPSINGAIIAMDAQTGLLKAVLGANWVTAVRTAGLSQVAARKLADPKSSVIAFIGCGVQARSHLDAFASEFPLREVRAFGRGRANVEALCEIARQRGLAASARDDANMAMDGADIVVSSVALDYTIQPFLDARGLKPGAFAAITDLAIPWLPETLAAFGTIVVDDREQEATAERPMVPAGSIAGDLAELAAGSVDVRSGAPSAFAFRGIALGDYAVTALALSRARKAGAGLRLST